MSKVTTREGVNPQEKIDELRKAANTEYFDIMLMHYQHVATWPTDTVRWQDGIMEAQSKKIVVGRGASVHGLPALRRFPGNQWVDIAMIRMNHKGTKMDAEDYNTGGPGNVTEVVSHVKAGPKRPHGRDQHEADRRRSIHNARRPPGRDEVRLPKRQSG